MSTRHSVQESFLTQLREEQVPVSVFLANGIRLQGQIESFDQFVVMLTETASQQIYKHAISTIVPSHPVRVNGTHEDQAES